MMRKTVLAMLAGAPAAVALDLAHDLLALEMPAAALPEAAAGRTASQGPVERFTVQRGLAVLPVRGLLTPNSAVLERWFGWSTYHGLCEAAAELAERADVAAVALDIDSPGGLVIGCEGAAEAIAALAKVKPVHAIASPMAASAAYWVGSQATSLAVTPGGVVGSIGVAVHASTVVGPDQWGERRFALTSTNARAKWPDPGTEEGMAELRRSLDEVEARFHAAVSAGRQIPAADLASRLSVTEDPRDGGAVFSGADAVARGLADSIESRLAFYGRLAKTYAAAPRPAPGARYKAQAAAALALARA